MEIGSWSVEEIKLRIDRLDAKWQKIIAFLESSDTIQMTWEDSCSDFLQPDLQSLSGVQGQTAMSHSEYSGVGYYFLLWTLVVSCYKYICQSVVDLAIFESEVHQKQWILNNQWILRAFGVDSRSWTVKKPNVRRNTGNNRCCEWVASTVTPTDPEQVPENMVLPKVWRVAPWWKSVAMGALMVAWKTIVCGRIKNPKK